MALTDQQLNRATLARQMLLAREPIGAVEAVQRIVAIQAQEPASPYIALWNRVAGFDPTTLDHAFADQALVKASLMRITLHIVHLDDYVTFHEAMAPNLRASRLNDRRYRSAGLAVTDAEEALPHLVEFASQARTAAEMEKFIETLRGAPAKWLWWALKTFAPLAHAPTGPPWSFGLRPSYRAAPELSRPSPEAGLARLLWRYLEGFGPASARDFAQFALQRQPPIKAALAMLGDQLVEVVGPDGQVLYDVPDAVVPAADTPAPARLMAMWDSTLLAYADRTRIIPERHRKQVIRRNGDTLPTVLVDGYVAGVWRPTGAGGVEISAFDPWPEDVWIELADEVSSLLALLADRDPTVYSRYARWWEQLDVADTRVLG